MRRVAAIWLVLTAVYALVIVLGAARGARYSAAESHRLMTAASIADDQDVDLRNQYADHTWRRWHGPALRPTGAIVGGRRVEPQGLGFPALIAPAYAIGGAKAVELECAALLALAFALAALLARRLVPEPWATRGALAVALSPPALAGAGAISPAAPGALILTGGAALALSVRERPEVGAAFWGAALVGLTPWLDLHLTIPAAVIALATARWLRRRQRGLAGFVALEVVLTSGVVFVSINDRLFGGFTAYAARLSRGAPSGAGDLGDYLSRLGRVATLLFDPDAGVVRWAPVTALVFGGLWVLAHSRRERLARAVPEQVDREVAAGFLALVVAAAFASAVFLRPSLGGDTLVSPDILATLGCAVPLLAWGLRRFARPATVLVVATLAFDAWWILS